MRPSPDAETERFLAEAASRSRPSLHLLPPVEARAHYERESTPTEPLPAMHTTTEVSLPNAGAMLYRPSPGILPVVVYLHGGGWVVGSTRTHERMCRELALLSACAVLSVDYRLAPEQPYPAAVDDVMDAVSWLLSRGHEHALDVGRLAIAGDSAGGNLAVAAALRCRDDGVPIRCQVLFYPVTTTDLSIGVDPAYDGLVLSRDELAWHQDQYLPDLADRHRPETSPWDRADLSGLPETLVVVAQCDPIAPQGLGYVAALDEAGVRASHRVFEGSVHGFVQYPDRLHAGRRALTEAGEILRRALHGPPPRGQP